MEEALNNLVVEIEIELPTEKPNREDVSAAINKVFLAPWDSMTEIVPSYWQAYFAKREGKPQPAPPPEKDTVYSVKPGEISPPHVTFDPDPPYPAEAQKSKYQGTVVMSLIVDPAGTPRDLQIERPLGMGLDEKAVAAVRTRKFDPRAKRRQARGSRDRHRSIFPTLLAIRTTERILYRIGLYKGANDNANR
jgi:TonB family protein